MVSFDSLLGVFNWVGLADYFNLLKIISSNANTAAHSEIQMSLKSKE